MIAICMTFPRFRCGWRVFGWLVGLACFRLARLAGSLGWLAQSVAAAGRKRRRYSPGLTPRARMKARRIASGVPYPQARARLLDAVGGVFQAAPGGLEPDPVDVTP